MQHFHKVVESTLYHDKWIGENPPFTQAVYIEDLVKRKYDIDVSPSSCATISQKIEYMNCQFRGGSISNSTLTLQAFGKKPIEDIHIRIRIMEKDSIG